MITGYDSFMNQNECMHEGQLINQCADCIIRAFNAEFPGQFTLIKSDAEFIANCINSFDAKNPETYFDAEIDDELLGEIDEKFDIVSPLIIDFINIMIFG